MGKLVGKKGRRGEKKETRQGKKTYKYFYIKKKQKAKRGIFVQGGGLSPSPPPSDPTAPKAKPMNMETEIIGHAIRLIRVGGDG